MECMFVCAEYMHVYGSGADSGLDESSPLL